MYYEQPKPAFKAIHVKDLLLRNIAGSKLSKMLILLDLYKYKLLITILLSALLLTANGKIVATAPKMTYLKEGDDALFMVNTSKSIRYSQFGGNRNGNESLDPNPMFLRVDWDNRQQSTPALKNNEFLLRERLEFVGNHADGHAWYIIHNVQLSDTSTYKIYYVQIGKAPSKENFIVKVLKVTDTSNETTKVNPVVNSTDSFGNITTSKPTITLFGNITTSKPTINKTPIEGTHNKIRNWIFGAIPPIFFVCCVLSCPVLWRLHKPRRACNQKQGKTEENIKLVKGNHEQPKGNLEQPEEHHGAGNDKGAPRSSDGNLYGRPDVPLAL